MGWGPFEVADLAAYLASKESGYITGQAINVDGGLLIGPLKCGIRNADCGIRKMIGTQMNADFQDAIKSNPPFSKGKKNLMIHRIPSFGIRARIEG